MAFKTIPFSPENLWFKIQIMFPNLEELIFISGPTLKGAEQMVDDLVEVSVTRYKDRSPQSVDGRVGVVATCKVFEIVISHNDRNAYGYFNPFSIKFMTP
jgi:hypothetical protein